MVPMSNQRTAPTQDTEHDGLRAELLAIMDTERNAGRACSPLAMDALLRLDYLKAGFVFPASINV